jgi:hypothetical protein
MTASSKISTTKQKFKVATFILVALIVVGNYFYQQGIHQQQLELKIKKYQNLTAKYEIRGKSCLSMNDSPKPNFENNVRSKERIDSVWNYYLGIMMAKCFIDSDGTIFSNPYKGLEKSDWRNLPNNSPGNDILQGFYFDVDRGMPFLRSGGSICSDGSYSPSVGRGTCSWHGGYGKQQGTRFEFQSAEQIYDPRRMLKVLTGNS